MKFLIVNYPKKPKYYIFLFGAFILINSLKVLASEDKLHIGKNNETYDFEQVYFQNSIPYGKYDNLYGQLNSFFGLNSDISETSYYPDLKIISDSNALRAIYRSKLNDMIINENINLKK